MNGNESNETNEPRWRHFIDCSQIGTWEWDIQTGQILINDVCAQIVGYSLEELAPVTMGGVVPVGDAPALGWRGR